MTDRPPARIYTKADYAPFVGKSGDANKGLQPLPNAEDVDPLEFLNTIAGGGHQMLPMWGYAIIIDPHGGHQRQQWTQFFLLIDDGRGYAVTYGGQRWEPAEKGMKAVATPIVRRFAICKHEFVGTGTVEQSQRGWRPGYCKLCGLDMSVDSGD